MFDYFPGFKTHNEGKPRYLKRLLKNGLALQIGNVFIDRTNLIDRRFACLPDECLRKTACCCEYFDIIEVHKTQVQDIDNIMDCIAELLPKLRDGGTYENVFEHQPGQPDYYLIAKDDLDSCPFLLYQDDPPRRCAVHTACLRHDLPLTKYKPFRCLAWPMIVKTIDDNEYFLTIRDSDIPLFSCLSDSKCQNIGIPLYKHLSDVLCALFGTQFLEDMNAALEGGRNE